MNIPEDIIVYYTLKNLPKEYEIFKRIHIAAQTLPTYEQLETKLIYEETSIKMENQQKEDGETFFLHRNRRPQPNLKHGHFPTSQNSRYPHIHRRYTDSGGSSVSRTSTLAYSGGFPASRFSNQSTHFGSTHGRNSHTTHQPRFRSRGPDKPRNDLWFGRSFRKIM